MSKHNEEINVAPQSLTLIRRKLFMAKRLYEHGMEHSLKDGELDKMIAIHNMHNAIEIVLKTIISAYEIDIHPRASFPQLLKHISSAKRKKEGRVLTLPYQREVEGLNFQRNNVQHAAEEPSDAIVEEKRHISKAFLERTFREFFDLDFNSLSSVDLIRDGNIHELLVLVDQRRDQLEAMDVTQLEGDKAWDLWLESLAALESTFIISLRNVLEQSLAPSTIRHLMKVPEGKRDAKTRDITKSELWRRVRSLEIFNLCQLLEIDYWRLMDLSEHAPTIIIDQSGKIWLMHATDRSPDVTYLKRMIAFLVSLAIDWETRGWLGHTSFDYTDPYSSLARAFMNGEAVESSPSLENMRDLRNAGDRADILSTLHFGFEDRSLRGQVTFG